MPKEVNYLRQLPQTYGLTGRRMRTPLVDKYADRVFGRANTPIHAPEPGATPAPAPAIRPDPGFRPDDGGPGIGPGQSRVGGFERGNDWGNNPDPVQAALEQQAMEFGSPNLFGLSTIRGGRTALALSQMGLPAESVLQGSILAGASAVPLSMINRGIPSVFNQMGHKGRGMDVLEGAR